MNTYLIPFIVIVCAVGMAAVECTHPARLWPQVPGWWIRAITLNLVQIAMVFLAGFFWDSYLQTIPLWSIRHWPITLQAFIAYVVITFVYYGWHRIRHESTFLWRWVHQIHHSPQRIEIITSFYKHPIEILLNGILSSLIVYVLVGVSPLAGSYAVLLTGLAELFYHWNIKTPYWLGFLIQRPESHCIHHQQGLHYYNFADIPLWDILFGTFKNPKVWKSQCGFSNSKEIEIFKMLAGRNIGK